MGPTRRAPREGKRAKGQAKVRDIRTRARDDRYQIHLARQSLDAAAAGLQSAGYGRSCWTSVTSDDPSESGLQSPVFMSTPKDSLALVLRCRLFVFRADTNQLYSIPAQMRFPLHIMATVLRRFPRLWLFCSVCPDRHM